MESKIPVNEGLCFVLRSYYTTLLIQMYLLWSAAGDEFGYSFPVLILQVVEFRGIHERSEHQIQRHGSWWTVLIAYHPADDKLLLADTKVWIKRKEGMGFDYAKSGQVKAL